MSQKIIIQFYLMIGEYNTVEQLKILSQDQFQLT